MHPDVDELIRERILRDPQLIHAVFSGESLRRTPPWIKVTVRPVQIKGQVLFQFQYYDTTKSTTLNFDGAAAGGRLDEVIARSFRRCYIKGQTKGVQIQLTKRNRALVREIAAAGCEQRDLRHDRRKRRLITADGESRLLFEIGIADSNGAIKPTMQAKYRQINEFLKILHSTITQGAGGTEGPDRIVDFGCGNAYLTFAAYEYLHNTLGLPVHVTGVDQDAAAIERHTETARRLGWSRIDFTVSNIIGYTPPEETPDIVLALHACDTASDEALARAIGWGSSHVLCVPCCHHDLQTQLHSSRVSPALRPVLRYGLLTQHLGDLATDTFRALILTASGYRVSVLQFVSPEHTSRNLMIAATKEKTPGVEAALEEYRRLKDLLQVTPHLETLLSGVPGLPGKSLGE